MFRRSKLLIAILATLSAPSIANAITIGDIYVQSSIGQHFHGVVKTGSDCVTLANPQSTGFPGFRGYVEQDSPGRFSIRSKDVITEPVISLALEVGCNNESSMTREYEVMLDLQSESSLLPVAVIVNVKALPEVKKKPRHNKPSHLSKPQIKAAIEDIKTVTPVQATPAVVVEVPVKTTEYKASEAEIEAQAKLDKVSAAQEAAIKRVVESEARVADLQAKIDVVDGQIAALKGDKPAEVIPAVVAPTVKAVTKTTVIKAAPAPLSAQPGDELPIGLLAGLGALIALIGGIFVFKKSSSKNKDDKKEEASEFAAYHNKDSEINETTVVSDGPLPVEVFKRKELSFNGVTQPTHDDAPESSTVITGIDDNTDDHPTPSVILNGDEMLDFGDSDGSDIFTWGSKSGEDSDDRPAMTVIIDVEPDTESIDAEPDTVFNLEQEPEHPMFSLSAPVKTTKNVLE